MSGLNSTAETRPPVARSIFRTSVAGIGRVPLTSWLTNCGVTPISCARASWEPMQSIAFLMACKFMCDIQAQLFISVKRGLFVAVLRSVDN